MKRLVGLAILVCLAASPVVLAQESDFRVLVFTRTEGFRHSSIPYGVEALRSLGASNGFIVDHTEDPAAFNDDNLARYTVVVFLNTTGSVMTDPGRTALERFVRAGGGWAGIHSAADTEYDWPFYGVLLGGGAWFKSHPLLPQPGLFINEAPDQPSTAHLPARWLIPLEEYYSFQRNPRAHVRVLLTIDETTYLQDPNTTALDDPPLGETGRMGDHPMSWCHDNAGGRAWYTALGHQSSFGDAGGPPEPNTGLYEDPAFRQHLLGGILTAARKVSADCTSRSPIPT